MKICVICDKEKLFKAFFSIINMSDDHVVDYYCSPGISKIEESNVPISPIVIKEKGLDFFLKYDIVFSLHCNQVFPKWLTDNIKCVNIHPGYNPYNRGWYPHVFSILNDYPAGATIHIMDEKIDHGKVFFRKKVFINDWETSEDVYKKIINAEIELLNDHLMEIISDQASAYQTEEGNINTKEDFKKICKIDLDKQTTAREFIKLLRATSFNGFNNLYFTGDDGRKIYIRAIFERE